MTRDTLTRDQILAAAIELLDAEGLEGLSMRALGSRLGSAATAVYWHVGSKGNLIALAVDRVWNEIALPDLTVTDWRAAAATMATDLYAMLIGHPWVLEAFGSFFLFGPGKARHDDHSLALFEAAGFTKSRADQAATTVFTFVLGNALGPAAAVSLGRRLEREGGNGEQRMRESMTRAREIAMQFPRLRARLGTVAAADYGAAPTKSFELGLRAILDGLEALLVVAPARIARARPRGR